MAVKKVTVTVDADRLRAVRELVRTGRARDLSAFVDHAIAVALDDHTGWAVDLELRQAAGGH